MILIFSRTEPVEPPAEEHTEGDDPFVVSQSGRTSPSTREAIQGMLSMGRAVQFSSVLSPQSQLRGSPLDSASPLLLSTGTSIVNLNSNSSSPMRGMLKRKRKVKIHVPNISEEDDFLNSCHQDAEFGEILYNILQFIRYDCQCQPIKYNTVDA